MKYVQGAGKQVHDHCNHWIDTTQSIQWTSVTPPNLGGGKTEALGVKTTAGTRGTAKTRWAARGAPAVTPSTDEILPPIRRTPRLSSQEIRRAEEIGESRLYRENDRKPSVDPRRRSWLNISKHAESSTDILNEFHRPRHNDTNCQRPRFCRDFDKNESTIVKMNASCTICAIMKRLQLNKANTSDKETSFLDLNLKVICSDVHTSVYEKRDDFGFPIVIFPLLSGDVPRLQSYGIYISQLVRFARCYTSISGFNSENLQIICTSKILTQSYRYIKLRKAFGKFFPSYFDLSSNLGVISFQEYVTEGISHPVFHGDQVYKLRRVKYEANFVSSGSKIVKHLRRRKYDPVIIERTIGLVFGPSTALYRSFLKDCTLTNKAVGTIRRDLSKPLQRIQGRDPRPLWLLVGTPLVLGPELASRQRIIAYSDGCLYIFLIYCFYHLRCLCYNFYGLSA